MNIAELLKDCIRSFNLDANKLRDLAFSICLADKKDGTNHIELDIDKFVEHDAELSWDNILRFLTITPQSKGCSSLPRVQKLRVISDVLTLSLSNEVPDLVLTCKSSKLVAKYLGVSLPSIDYASEDECLDNLCKIKDYISVTSVDLDSIESVYVRLIKYRDKMKEVGDIELPSAVNELPVPDKIYAGLGKSVTLQKFLGYLDSKEITIDNYANYMVDVYSYEIVQVIAKILNKKLEHNEIEYNLILTRALSSANAYLPIGSYSLTGNTYRLSVLRSVPAYLCRKTNAVFSENTSFSEMTLLGCIALLYYIRKINTKKDYLISEMEGFVNECRG